MQEITSNFMMSKGEYLTLHMKSTTSLLVSKILQSKKGNFFLSLMKSSIVCMCFFLHICDTLSLEMGKNCTCFGRKFKSTTTITNHQQVKKRPTTLLKLKWGIVKHDISKFVGCFGLVTTLNKLKSSLKNLLKSNLELYK